MLPDARGQAARLIEEANGYRDQVVARAEGDAARFTQLATEYKKAPEVTRERLYLETMETVMTGTRKVLVDSENSNNMLYIPVDSKAAPSAPDLPIAAAINSATAAASADITNTNSASPAPRQQRPLAPGQVRESRQ